MSNVLPCKRPSLEERARGPSSEVLPVVDRVACWDHYVRMCAHGKQT